MDYQDILEQANRSLLAGMKAGQEIERLHRAPINRFDYTQIPPHMMGSLLRYTQDHCPVGDFLQAVICNDLTNAFGYADNTNIEIIGVYVAWFYNHAPSTCHGSRERYLKWIAREPA